VSMDYYKAWWIFVNHMGLNVAKKEFETCCWSATDWEGILCTLWDLNWVLHVCQWLAAKSHGFFYIIWDSMWLKWTLKFIVVVLEIRREFYVLIGIWLNYSHVRQWITMASHGFFYRSRGIKCDYYGFWNLMLECYRLWGNFMYSLGFELSCSNRLIDHCKI